MDWASNLFVALLMTGISGTIFFLAGGIIRKCIKKDVRFLRFLFKVTLCTYLLPFVYFVLYAGEWFDMVRDGRAINLFYGTSVIFNISAVFGCIWLGMFVVLLIHKMFCRHFWMEICKGNIPEEDEATCKVFHDICAELGIDGEVSLCRNDMVQTPCITYCHGYVVILPLVCYTEKQAKVIFYHELCHYLNGDMHLKTVSVIAALLHVFNPAVYFLLGQMDLICEKYCDRAACEKGIDAFTRKEYFEIILELMISDGKKNRYQLFALADRKSNYERRVAYMLGFHKHGGLKRRSAVILGAVFLAGSSITSLAAGGGVANVYQEVAERTSNKEAELADTESSFGGESDEEMILEELSRNYDLDPSKVNFMEDDGIEPQDLIRQIKWSVPPGETCVSTGFSQEIGDSVTITVVGDPDTVDYQMGIKDPKFVMRYVEGSGKLYHDFEIELKGRHYFFVCNLSETEDLNIDAVIVR